MTSSQASYKSMTEGVLPTSPQLPLQGNIAGEPGQLAGLPFYNHRIVYIYCTCCGEQKLVKMKCGHRSCPECRKRDYARLLRLYSRPLMQYQKDKRLGIGEFKLLTLTMKTLKPSARDDMTVDRVRLQIKKLREGFNAMRRWKKYEHILRGGLRSIEVKVTDKGEWNVHCHIVYEGAYHPVCCKEMKNANSRSAEARVEATRCGKCLDKCFRFDWKTVSGNTVVDVKRAYNPRSGLRYILKYISKPPQVDGRYDLYDRILKGSRMVQPFGSWFSMAVERPVVICPCCDGELWMSEFQINSIFEEMEGRTVKRRIRSMPMIVYDEQLLLELDCNRLRRVAG